MSVPYYANAPLPDTNSRQIAQVIRMPSTALLTIDSEDRYKDYIEARSILSSPYDFSIKKSESLMAGFITRLGISEVVFPWTIPNINLKTNKISVSTLRGSTQRTDIITLPIGFYTPSQLASALQTAINTITGGTYQIYYGQQDVSGQPRFSYYAPLTDEIGFNPLPYNTPAYPYGPTTKQLFDLMGFYAVNTLQASGIQPGLYTLCEAIRYVDIVCNQLTNSQAQKDQTSQTIARDMLCRIYVGSASGVQSTIDPGDPAFCPPGCAPTVIYRNYNDPKRIQWIPNQNIPGFLQFVVYDDAGDQLDNSITSTGSSLEASAGDWSMTMLVSEN